MTPQQTLQKYFGYGNFREGQLEIIQAIIHKKPTLAILHTGGGKSICFQIPGLIFPGITIVISPLISLMKDQVDQLRHRHIPATYINSTLEKKEIQNRYQQITENSYKFVYVAPERLNSLQFIKLCQNIEISFIAVDEAHCISMWGHDFRPSYLNIMNFVHKLKLKTKLAIAAFTATATPQVRADIISQLQLQEPQIFLNTFKRDNLSFWVIPCLDSFNQELALFIILKKHISQAGIIYTTTRLKAEYLTRLIKHYWGQDFPIAAYHAGLEKELRAQTQDDFIKNKLHMIVATNAFGMGVDKPNVRWVIHYQMPGSIENYYQEAGRAGRDKKPANCYLLSNPADVKIQYEFICHTHPDKKHPRHKHQLQQLKKLIGYAQATHCRQQFLLEYFGEKSTTCGECDTCTHQKLTLSAADKEYYQRLVSIQKENQELIFTRKLLLLLSLHHPQTVQEYLKIPGIGAGWVEKWYNLISAKLEKGVLYVDDFTTID